MLDASISVFIFSSLFIILSPGQDMVLLMSNSIARGPAAGVLTAAGISTALLLHTLLVALGLGALLQSSPMAFNIMKYAGAAYLLYLALQSYRAPIIHLKDSAVSGQAIFNDFSKGVLSNISNPKVAIFYVAYLPQFVRPEITTGTEIQLLVLGGLFAALTFIVKLPIGYSAGKLAGWIQARPQIQRWMHRASGTVLLAMSLRLATDSNQ